MTEQDMSTDLVAGVEKFVYSQFRLQQVVFKRSHLPRRISDFTTLELPDRSVVHTVDQLLTPQSGVSTINPTLPFLTNERFERYLDNCLTIPTADEDPFKVTDRYRFVPTQFNTELRQFFSEHKDFRRMISKEFALGKNNALSVFNYNALYRTFVTGRFSEYRKFDIVLRSILSNVTTIAGKHQFLHIPLSTSIYTRQHFYRAFTKLDPQTVRFKNDPSYFFLIHFLGMLVENGTTSLFNKLDDAQLDTLYVIFSCGNEAIIYNLGDLKAMVNNAQFHQLVLRHVNTLKLLGHADIEALDKLSDDEFDTMTEQAATPEPDVDALEPPPDHLRISEAVKRKVSGKAAGSTPAGTPAPDTTQTQSASPASTAPQQVTPQQQPAPARPSEALAQAAKQSIDQDERLSDKQKEAVVKVTEVWKTLSINGIPLTTLVDDQNESQPETKTLDFLKGQIPDESMLSSSIVNYDQHYTEKMMLRDIVNVALSFAAQGMFLVGIEEQTVITQLDRIRIYKFTYADATGKRHTVTVKLPIVSPDGTFLVNGVEQRMSKQMVNLPICKISPVRVNLSSNYNKTLVERTLTKAHTFDTLLSNYIFKVYKETNAIKITYGSLEAGETKLPYDYACLAARYASLQFDGYDFIFDHKNRLHNVSEMVQIRAASTEEDAQAVRRLFKTVFGTYPDAEVSSKLLAMGIRKGDETVLIAEDKGTIVGFIHYGPGSKYQGYEQSYTVYAVGVAPGTSRKHGTGALLLRKVEEIARNRGAHGVTLTSDAHLVPYYEKLGYTKIPGAPDGRQAFFRAATVGAVEAVSQTVDPARPPQYLTTGELRKRAVQAMEREFGVYCGTYGNVRLFFGQDNVIRHIDPQKLKFANGQPDYSDVMVNKERFWDILVRVFGTKVPAPRMISEWTELKILDKNFPIVYVLGFRYGLKSILDELNVPYMVVPKGDRSIPMKPTSIRVSFADFNLYFDRYPFEGSLILSGLNKFDLSKYPMSAFDSPDVYYTLFEDNGVKLNYLKGITSFFDLFVDPITRNILTKMGEPTTVKGLLYRATQMLVTTDARQASSTKNLRYRGYERFPAVMYNEMARAMATYQARRGSKDSFSINPESVFLRIISDATVNLVENLNPVNDVKSKTVITYTGSGGRTAQSFVVNDRVYPADGVGVISEATPDSNKVAITAYTPVDPLVVNGRGMFPTEETDLNALQPTQILSVSALLMPGSTQDDRVVLPNSNVRIEFSLIARISR